MRLASALMLVAVGLLAGCVSTQPINKYYADELGQLEPGTSLSEFQQIMPDAVVAGQTMIEGERVDAYEVTHLYMYDSWYGFTRDEKLWFYFHDKQLVKWGPPDAWPERADLIVETRLR